MILSSELPPPTPPFLPCDASAKFESLKCIRLLFYGPLYQFILLSFTSKCCAHLSELERSSGTLCSYRMKLQYFSQFASLLINHQLPRCLPYVKLKITSPKNTSSATLPPRATQSWSQSIYFVMSID
jgi:hypothetical protein